MPVHHNRNGRKWKETQKGEKSFHWVDLRNGSMKDQRPNRNIEKQLTPMDKKRSQEHQWFEIDECFHEHQRPKRKTSYKRNQRPTNIETQSTPQNTASKTPPTNITHKIHKRSTRSTRSTLLTPSTVTDVRHGGSVRAGDFGAHGRGKRVTAVAKRHGGQVRPRRFEAQVPVADGAGIADVRTDHRVFGHGLFQFAQDLAWDL